MGQMGYLLKEVIKPGKIQSMSTLQASSKAIQSGSICSAKKKKEEELAIVTFYQPSPPPRANQYPQTLILQLNPLILQSTIPSHVTIHPEPIHTQTHHDHMPLYKPPLIKTDLLMLPDHALTSKHRTLEISPQLLNLWPNYFKG